ncbi:Uncharacterized protein Adt_43324 [Abeliophyllum distichum]|uniref:Uncharacterized protein n=1 Tax=Abeliophyllum distichum TaxID=126358 RepID=A0ABD1P7P9_9LAMI
MNRSRVTFLIGELQKTRKGSMSIDQYLNVVKQLVDNLEVAGKAIPLSDLVTQVLAGLDEEYMGSRPDQQHQSNRSNPNALVASPLNIAYPIWFENSGASNHVTARQDNMAETHEYGGKQKLIVGNDLDADREVEVLSSDNILVPQDQQAVDQIE